MMHNFTKILQWLSTIVEASSKNDNFGGATPFKIQVNFDIPLFEGQLQVDTLKKWLNKLEIYYYI